MANKENLEVIWDALHEWQDIHEGRNAVGA